MKQKIVYNKSTGRRNLLMFVNEKAIVEERVDAEELKYNEIKAVVHKKDLCLTMAYLMGAETSRTEKIYTKGVSLVVDWIKRSKDAINIRCLCYIRTVLMQSFHKTDNELRFRKKNLTEIDWISPKAIQALKENEINVRAFGDTAAQCVKNLNSLIEENIDKCKFLFPEWLEWDYIRGIFIIPSNVITRIGTEVEKFQKYRKFYPFEIYMHYNDLKAFTMYLRDDEKFLRTLYSVHNKEFDDRSKYVDASEDTKNDIYEFINNSRKTIIVVDCENADAFNFYGTLKGLDDDVISKIDKIILYDDVNTTVGWNYLSKHIDVPIERVNVKRLLRNKSLVDIQLTAGVCKGFYNDKIDSFIIVSSDSDQWGIIESIPEANFYIMVEKKHCSVKLMKALEQKEIKYCAVDDFYSGKAESLKRTVLLDKLKEKLKDTSKKQNASKLTEEIYCECKITASIQERDQFLKRYVQPACAKKKKKKEALVT